MSCCGNKRKEYVRSRPFTHSSDLPTVPVKMPEDVSVEYTGYTGLTVTGTITGNKYRFSGTGDIQLVDYRDAGGLMAIPVLKKSKIKADH